MNIELFLTGMFSGVMGFVFGIIVTTIYNMICEEKEESQRRLKNLEDKIDTIKVNFPFVRKEYRK